MTFQRLFPLYKPACFYLVGLAIFFFTSYGLANSYTASLDVVPSLSYSWEKYIPFLPWTIIPYWSIDLLYGISLFICTTKRELHLHALRLFAASCFCCICFIIFPLACRAEIPDVSNPVFHFLFFDIQAVDTPFNQAPSLHIALAWLVWLRFYAHTKGIIRPLFTAWFILIGISVLTCYQHHFIDVPLGLLLGVLISYIIPLKTYVRHIPPIGLKRKKLALFYLLSCLLLALPAFFCKGAALWLLWPALSCLIVCLGYMGYGTVVFQKDESGKLSLSARFLLAPYLVMTRLSQCYFMRNIPTISPITQNLYIGSRPFSAKIQQDGLFDMTAELDSSHISCPHKIIFPWMDLTPLPPHDLQQAGKALLQLSQQGSVLVCCALGLSRSAAAAAAFLVLSGQAPSVIQAIELIQKFRPQILLNSHQIAYLLQWEQIYIIKKSFQ